MMNIYIKILLLSLVSVVVLHFGRLYFVIKGYGRSVLRHYPGECRLVEGFTTDGSEDMTLLPDGKVIITSGLSFGDSDYKTKIHIGELYLMEMTRNTKQVEKLDIVGWPDGERFEPHGVHHWVHENKSVSVFVVLHLPETVGRFIYDGKKTLTLTKTYRMPELMRNINSVYVTGEDSFYLTNLFNARYQTEHLTLIAEQLLMLPMGSVVYIEGGEGRVVLDGLLMSNGIAGHNTYVYLMTKDVVRIYSRRSDNSLAFYKAIDIAIGSMDNAWVDAEGNLWIGAQTTLEDVAQHLQNPDHPSPSTVLRVRDPVGDAVVESVLSDIDMIKAASVALYHNNTLLVGTVRDKMLSCHVNYLS